MLGGAVIGMICLSVFVAGPHHKAKTPRMAKTTADMRCTQTRETLRVMASPNHTTGALANIMPRVVPATTQNQV